MAIYKVVLNGKAFGQDIKNILWYRNGIGVDLSGLTVGGTVEVATAVKDTVWPLMKAVMPAAYMLQDITSYVWDESTFNLLYQNPTTVGVGEQGVVTGGTNGPAVCAIVNFALEPTSIVFNGPKPPKKGYLAIGPLADDWIGDSAEMPKASGQKPAWDALCFALSNNVETLLPPGLFFPIRVHQTKILNVWKIDSFADVRDATLRHYASYRRSRQPEN